MCRDKTWGSYSSCILLDKVLSLLKILDVPAEAPTLCSPSPKCFVFLLDSLFSVIWKEPCQEDLPVSTVMV